MEIYEYVLTYQSLTCKGGHWGITDPGSKRRSVAYHLRPTMVCKQMRKEMLRLPLSLNTLVIGNEYPDVDPYYEWWIAPPIKNPCLWALNAIDKMPAAFASESTAFRLNLWIYPGMVQMQHMKASDWEELEEVFGKLLRQVPGKLTITLHYYCHYEHLKCQYPQGSRLAIYGQSTLESGDEAASWKKRITGVIDDGRRALEGHDDHDDSEQCRVKPYEDWLTKGLNEVELLVDKLLRIIQDGPTGKSTTVAAES